MQLMEQVTEQVTEHLTEELTEQLTVWASSALTSSARATGGRCLLE